MHAIQGSEGAQSVEQRSTTGGAAWAGVPQQGPPPPRVKTPPRQFLSGEASRGRSPVPDPTGTEDSPLSQVRMLSGHPSYACLLRAVKDKGGAHI